MHPVAPTLDGTRSAAGLRRRLGAGILCLCVGSAPVAAGEIYKSVDANGNVVYSDHLDRSMSQSTVVPLAASDLPPRELHFCWTNCFTLVYEDGVYRRTDGTDETWTVETFSGDGIVMHRHDAPADWNGHSADVVYAGRVSNDRLVGVTINGVPTSGVDASWGTALNTLPGSNQERDSPKSAPASASSDASLSTATAPPALPEEEQPALPQDGLLWTPGYWYWRDQGYFWIPGAWLRPPRVGFLWTPGYWAIAGALFVFHPGHWGSTVGFYGGVNYGYGYFGNGYTGGRWVGNAFSYNSAVNHVTPAVARHTYAEAVADQGSRGVVAHAVVVHNSAAPRPTTPPPPTSRPVSRPTTLATAPAAPLPRSRAPEEPPAAVNRPAAPVRPPPVRAPAPVVRATHRPAPVR